MQRVSTCLRHFIYFQAFLLVLWEAQLIAAGPPIPAEKSASTQTKVAKPTPGSLHTGHFFNARLMPDNNYQINAASHFRAGMTPDLEISVIGLGFVFQPTIWNLGLKHRMFETTASRTSFNSHTVAFKNNVELWVASLHGFVTSFSLTADQDFSIGIMDGLIMTFASDVQSSLHLLTPVFAWDYSLTRNWAVSVIFARPVYAVGELESEASGKGNLEIDFTQRNYNPGLGFLTVNYRWSRASLEVGLVYFSAAFEVLVPYLNFAWRFGGQKS